MIGQLSHLLLVSNEWYTRYIKVIIEEYHRVLNNQSTFSPEDIIFVRRNVEVEASNHLLLITLINNFLRCIINLSTLTRFPLLWV